MVVNYNEHGSFKADLSENEGFIESKVTTKLCQGWYITCSGRVVKPNVILSMKMCFIFSVLLN